MSGMARAFLAMAAWTTAAPFDQDEAGRQDRGFGMKLFETSLEMTADQGRMFWDFKECWVAQGVRVHIGYVSILIRKGEENLSCEEIFFERILGARLRGPF